VRVFFVPLTILLLAAACGSSGPAAPPDPAVAVRDVPLVVDEMPADWHATPGGEDLESKVDIPPSCDIFAPTAVFTGALATAKSASFQGPSDQQSQTFAAIYGTPNDAQAAVAGTHEIAARCEDEFKDVLKRAAEDALGVDLGPFSSIDVEFGAKNDPPLGDVSAGYRVQVTVKVLGSKQKYTLDYRVFGVGRVAAAALYATFGDPNAGEEQAIEQALVTSATEQGQEPTGE
jgi:hypothetical protein